MSCRTHGHFTIYPIGHLPYTRTSVAPVSVSGDPIRTTGAGPLAMWRQTVFEAPITALHGEAWYRDLGRTDAFARRQTVQAAAILGLSRETDTLTAERIRGELRLPGLDHERARREFAAGRDHSGRAGAIVPLLGSLVIDSTLCGRILRAGALAGSWGQPRVLGHTSSSLPPPDPGPLRLPAGGRPHESVAVAPGDPPTLPLLARTSRPEPPSCTDMPSD